MVFAIALISGIEASFVRMRCSWSSDKRVSSYGLRMPWPGSFLVGDDGLLTIPVAFYPRDIFDGSDYREWRWFGEPLLAVRLLDVRPRASEASPLPSDHQAIRASSTITSVPAVPGLRFSTLSLFRQRSPADMYSNRR